jgi:hypothetical protein
MEQFLLLILTCDSYKIFRGCLADRLLTFTHGVPMLRPLAHRLMTQELGPRRTSDELALAGIGVYAKLLVHLSSILGEAGTYALFRSSLRLTPIPFLRELRAHEPQLVLEALTTALRDQAPDVVVETSTTLFTSFIELLATFVGERVTYTLLHDLWPDVFTGLPQEMRK